MKPAIKRWAVILFHIVILIYASILFFAGVDSIVYAQEERNYRLENLERRIADYEALKLDQRLTRIEAVFAAVESDRSNNWLNEAANGGVGLLLARAVYEEVRKRKAAED